MPPRIAVPTVRRAAALLLVLMVTAAWTEPASRAAAAGTSAENRAGWLDRGRDGTLAGERQIDPGFTAAVDFHERSAERLHRPVIERIRSISARPLANPESKLEKKPAAAPARTPSYSGTNRFWIPSLGMSDRVHLYPCSRTRPPDNYMYRWGCAGRNNVYLLGHAYSVMKPLHDAYVQGRLKVGMVAIYANANGKVTYYKVTQWRVVDPVDSEWAIASQRVPSMTLQTCVGKDSQYRLNVRLVAYK
jgi:hypothetical protein